MCATDATDPAGFAQIRVRVEIVSEAPREIVVAIVEMGNEVGDVLTLLSIDGVGDGEA